MNAFNLSLCDQILLLHWYNKKCILSYLDFHFCGLAIANKLQFYTLHLIEEFVASFKALLCEFSQLLLHILLNLPLHCIQLPTAVPLKGKLRPPQSLADIKDYARYWRRWARFFSTLLCEKLAPNTALPTTLCSTTKG